MARSARAATLCGALVTLSVGAVYSIGAGRAYGLDASVTVHRFVATPSLLDPLREQLVYNNHVLFSFVEHIVYSVTSSADEWVLRIVPIAASALAAGVLAWAVARRLGWLAGGTAALVVAVSPTLVLTGRDVRGYSLLLLACVLSTVLLFELRRVPAPGRLIAAGYVAALAAGIATHLYGLAMLPVHAAIVWPRGRAELGRWLMRWAAATALGLVAYAGVAGTMLDANTGRQFRPHFPIDLVREMLGGSLLTALLLAAPLVAGALLLARRGWALRGLVAAAAVVVAAWLVAPDALFARFFVWLVPVVAVTAAAGVARRPLLALALVALAVVQVVRLGGDFARSDLPNRGAADVARRVAAAGHVPCSSGLSALSMEPYYPVKTVDFAAGPPPCDVFFILTPGPAGARVPLPPGWDAAFPYRRKLDAANPGVALSRRPLSQLEGRA